jgi:ParB/RepB/Spo0J family partition protein
MKISSIKIGKRHRREMGDLQSLAASMSDIGLLHPVVVAKDGTLIAGERRLKAAEQLGWDSILATIVDLKEIVHGEAAENFIRKDFTPSEAVAIKRAIEPEIRVAARKRQAEGGRSKASANLAEASKGTARDKTSIHQDATDPKWDSMWSRPFDYPERI